jgi:hypothetical protein
MVTPATPIAPTPALLRNLPLDIEPDLDPTLILLAGARLTFLALLRTLLLLFMFSPRFPEAFGDLLELDPIADVLLLGLVRLFAVVLLAFAVDFFMLFRAPLELFFLLAILNTSLLAQKTQIRLIIIFFFHRPTQKLFYYECLAQRTMSCIPNRLKRFLYAAFSIREICLACYSPGALSLGMKEWSASNQEKEEMEKEKRDSLKGLSSPSRPR